MPANPLSNLELPAEILRFVRDEESDGRRAALVVVTDISGGSMRQVGSLSAVSESGEMAGYVSNGCIDADIARQALEALDSGEVKSLRYGAGSPFVDLRLPCGGSVDILIDPTPNPVALREALHALDARRAATVHFCRDHGLVTYGSADGGLKFVLTPCMKLILVGKGPPLLALATQAAAAGIVVGFATPDPDQRAALEGMGLEAEFEMLSPWSAVSFEADRWTAALLLFHDHEWETQVLKTALATDAFYVGCLGSKKTHTLRELSLLDEGLSPSDLDRIKGPIGLVPSMRSAPFLGISVLAEIVEVFGAVAKSGEEEVKSRAKAIAA